VINSVVEPRKKYLFAIVVTVALVTAILVYLCPLDHWEYLAAITILAILLCMLVALSTAGLDSHLFRVGTDGRRGTWYMLVDREATERALGEETRH